MTPYRTADPRPTTTFRVTRWMKLVVIYRRGSLGGVAGDFTYQEPRPWLRHFMRVLLGLPWPSRKPVPTRYRRGRL